MSEGFTTPPPQQPGFGGPPSEPGFGGPPPQPGFGGPAPAPRRRPVTVTVAGLLLLLTAVLAVVYLIANIAVVSDLDAAYKEAFAGTEAEDTTGFVTAFSIGGGVGYLLVALTLAILTAFLFQGRNGARITTWVVGGLGVCCGGLALASATLSNVGLPDDPNMPSQEEINDILAAHLPGWYGPVILVANIVGVLAVAVALILLALPPSNAFFRKQEEPFEPPPGYPQSGYPSVG